MEILAAYDLTGSYRAAAALADCSHHTVKALVQARDEGQPVGKRARRARAIEPFLDKIEEWVDMSRGKIRADVVFSKLQGMGYTGSDRSVRRAVAGVKTAYRTGHRRVHRPWVAEPGLWVQYDFGDGPVIDGRSSVLFVAWSAFSRFRVVFPIKDKTIPSVFAALDRVFRVLGGAPTYVLTDNEKTVTTMHIAGIPVRNTQMVSFARYYGVTVLTCQPADPATKGGAEASVKLAKADIVPTDANLRPAYVSWNELEDACQQFMDEINGKVHHVTKRRPVEALAEERTRFHPVPDRAHTVAFGLTRRVPENTPMVSYENGQYSVPYQLAGQEVFVTTHGAGSGEEVVIVHIGDDGPTEVARHKRARPGSPQLHADHFPDTRPRVPGQYTPRPATQEEREFLAIGHGAEAWLAEAAATGATRIRSKMARAVNLAGLHGTDAVDEALGVAAAYGRFEPDALASIIATRTSGAPPRTASEDLSLAQGTRGWAAITEPTQPGQEEAL